jgi:hypothetical protein
VRMEREARCWDVWNTPAAAVQQSASIPPPSAASCQEFEQTQSFVEI